VHALDRSATVTGLDMDGRIILSRVSD
jgi:hypothetical protein